MAKSPASTHKAVPKPKQPVSAPPKKESRWKRFGYFLMEIAGNIFYKGPR